ncbi:hypothetical protein P879_08477 [Paragonimus westermani]|uniref:Uncharacterized protein n=1 Tax=Paragonimus westermani TaxID=34504 RepID=A0A8T0CZT6_9TREM|nr:hypothetical protein P879_08477 [Paragonimus westermani]
MPGLFPGFPSSSPNPAPVPPGGSKVAFSTPDYASACSTSTVSEAAFSDMRTTNSREYFLKRGGHWKRPTASGVSAKTGHSACAHAPPSSAYMINPAVADRLTPAFPSRGCSTRRRHVSANAVLSSTDERAHVAQSSIEVPSVEHYNDHLEHLDSSIASDNTICTISQCASVDQPYSKGRHVYDHMTHHATTSAFQRSTQPPTNVRGFTSLSLSSSTSGEPPTSGRVPSFGASSSASSDLGTDGKTSELTIRLARAWQRKARRFQSDLFTRIKAIVFTECPTVLNLAMEGIGWGTHLFEESVQTNSSKDPTSPLLYKPSIIKSQVPSRVLEVRRWLAEKSVHYVTADLPIGTRLDEVSCATDEIQVLSSSTIEHDLIPATILDSALDFFNSKLGLDSKLNTNNGDVGSSTSDIAQKKGGLADTVETDPGLCRRTSGAIRVT